jgi:hypothetical protein
MTTSITEPIQSESVRAFFKADQSGSSGFTFASASAKLLANTSPETGAALLAIQHVDGLRKVELNAPVLDVPYSVERDVVRVGSIAAKNTRNDSVETYATVHNAPKDCPLRSPCR